MSLQAKGVLVCACSISLGIIGYVHYKQNLDRYTLHEGVLKEIERRQRHEVEKHYLLHKQNNLINEMEKELKQINDVQ